jgi:hypothetical protein
LLPSSQTVELSIFKITQPLKGPNLCSTSSTVRTSGFYSTSFHLRSSTDLSQKTT